MPSGKDPDDPTNVIADQDHPELTVRTHDSSLQDSVEVPELQGSGVRDTHTPRSQLHKLMLIQPAESHCWECEHCPYRSSSLHGSNYTCLFSEYSEAPIRRKVLIIFNIDVVTIGQ